MLSPDFAAVSGLTYREVDYWVRRGVLRPVVEARGSGSQRRFDPLEVRVAIVVRALRRMGAGLDVLAEVAVQLRERGDAGWHGWLFVDTHGLIRDSPCSMCFVLDLDEILPVAA